MQAESLEVLENAAVPPAQARAIVRAIEIELTGARDTLATKHDLLLRRQEMLQMGADLRQEMAEMGADLRQEMAELGAGLRKEIAEMGAALRVEIHATASGVARQMYLAVLGQSAVMLGFAYFVATQVR
jgi:hypothetical protein